MESNLEKDLYIFDLDGTLSLHHHRLHLANNDKWDDFSRACVHDVPNEPIIKIFNRLIHNIRWCSGDIRTPRADVFIFSGRSSMVFRETIHWLNKHTELTIDNIVKCLKMRTHGDNTPAEQLKKKWYDELSKEDKKRLACVFEDSPTVTAMWRSIGVTCVQVNEGSI